MDDLAILIVESWANTIGNVNTTNEIKEWISKRNEEIKVDISRIALQDSDYWFYNENSGTITNKNNSFFSISGLRRFNKNELVLEQPIIIQSEIGYLGIICKKIDGVLNFLMQAKIEPGNVNKIQISPTIQATKSNFMQKHGGRKPAYLDIFINASEYNIIVDQIQSEQSSRFYKKRNRNIIIRIDDEIDELPSHKWMTLGQIKELMRVDNIVNMDTRTVLSCIPYSLLMTNQTDLEKIEGLFTDKALFRSIFNNEVSMAKYLTEIYQFINNYKMFDETRIELCPLHTLDGWVFDRYEIRSINQYSFKIIFCEIDIEDREVTHWTQPLFEATGMATFGLFMSEINGVKKFLVKALSEVGCFDKIELGPSVQTEAGIHNKCNDEVAKLFFKCMRDTKHIKYDTVLSEEGGRFYCEQNRNTIIEIDYEIIDYLPEGYFWIDYYTLNHMVQVNNCMNIQLRNLLSMLRTAN